MKYKRKSPLSAKGLFVSVIIIGISGCGAEKKKERQENNIKIPENLVNSPESLPLQEPTRSLDEMDCQAKDPSLFKWVSDTKKCEGLGNPCDELQKSGSLVRKSFQSASAASKDACLIVEQSASCDEASGEISWPADLMSHCTFNYEANAAPYVIASEVFNHSVCEKTSLKATMSLEDRNPKLEQQSCEVRTPESLCLGDPENFVFQAGDGSLSRPFVICNNLQLNFITLLRTLENYTIPIEGSNGILGKDIKDTSVGIAGNYELGYHLDGNGKTLSITKPNTATHGFPGEVYTGTFKDLHYVQIENLRVECSDTFKVVFKQTNLTESFGLLAGAAVGSKFKNIRVKCDFAYEIAFPVFSSLINVGWLIGNSRNNTFENVVFEGEIVGGSPSMVGR